MIPSLDNSKTALAENEVEAKLAEIDALIAQASRLAETVRRDTGTSGSHVARAISTAANYAPAPQGSQSRGQIVARQKQLENRLEESAIEIATLTLLVRDLEADAELAVDNQEWLKQVALLSLSTPGWWAVMPAGWRRARMSERLARKKLFDGPAYLRLYPDVAAEGMDPLLHYIAHGMAEGRMR